MNPSTALAAAVVDELIRCGMREAVIAPGSRSAPLAMALHRRAEAGELRLNVRIDERSAAFCALGLAKASGMPVPVVCTSGTAAAHFHAAVIEADESCVPLLVLTADRPPELRGTGANQTIDQLKLYGSAVRWFCEVGVAEDGTPRSGYWRCVVSRAWGLASGSAGGPPGPVHLNLPLREPLVPDMERAGRGLVASGVDAADEVDDVTAADELTSSDEGLADVGLPVVADETGGVLAGRAGGAPWTRFDDLAELDWTERGLVVLGDGDYDARPLIELAQEAGWPVLAEPSSNGRRGPCALSAYQYLLADPGFMAGHQPDVIVSAGRPGLSRGQSALLGVGGRFRHVVLAQAPGRWSDPGRSATDVVARVRLAARRLAAAPPRDGVSGWTRAWLTADQACRKAVDAVLDRDGSLSEPWLVRHVSAALPAGALLWVASSLPVRDLDQHMTPRAGLRILASRGASGIDGLVSSATGAALAHQAAGGGPAVALLGDLALLHDAAGLFLGPDEPRPDLCLVAVNNDGGGIFSMLEQAAFPGPFERVFGTPHGASLLSLARAARMPYTRIEQPADLASVISELVVPKAGMRLVELQTSRDEQAELRRSLSRAAAAALAAMQA
jgi:2-succinyl-5-enolpyruvyl-6-hydroxy-3-cyclohexene-1-carboxylate synthase